MSGELRAPSLNSLLNMEFPPREHLIKPWLRDGESAMIYASPGVGKSMLTLTLALVIAGGGEFMGWKAPKPRKVLFVDGEMHIQDIIDRATLLLSGLDIDIEVATQNMTILARQYQLPEAEFPDLAFEEGRDWMLDFATMGDSDDQYDAEKYDLVILDNLSTLASIKDENDAGDFNEVLQFLMKLKQAKVACILVHHSNKNANNYRGSSKLATTFEVILGLKAVESIQSNGTSFKLCWDKFRCPRDETIQEREVWLEPNEELGAIWKSQLSKDDQIQTIINMLKTLEYPTQDALCKALPFECSKSKMSKLKSQAIANGYISKKEWNELLSMAAENQKQGEDEEQ
ncbi:AAA family ATPase [Maridesulfovibrio sp.]|uniref:AAA family ATPase n=1 Tax=Maridesulfovibrio sp. TaxID=2795000 RepID=UPI0039EFA0AE